ncbi:VWA domain-containing protein [Streptosporangiaceae bacterium NEAU-GS5]|nr:VWA domain-containing protein [Streptosporangiaceae bacterium NEAU-GS5]
MGGRHRTDELEGGYNPYREPHSRRRSSRGRVFVPLAGAVALAVLLGVAAYVVVNKPPTCNENKISLAVVASPDIQPAISKIGSKFAGKVGDRCVAVSVTAADSAAVAHALSGTATTAQQIKPDMWVPDSSLWLTKSAAQPAGSVAHSPVVLTASKSGAEKLQAAFSPASWTGLMNAANAANPDGLAKKVRVLALDPDQNAAGMSALLAGAAVLKANKATDELLAGVLRQLSESVVNTPDAMFATLTKEAARIPVGVASEQSIWAFNTKNSPSNPAIALYPAEGAVNLDYPIVVTTKDKDVQQAAAAFAKNLTSAAAQKTIQDYGFRTTAGKGALLKTEYGVNPKNPRAIPLPDAASVTKLAQAWRLIKLGTKILSLNDISGTMALPADKTGITRIRAIAQVAQEGLKLFPDKTEIGTWVFSDNLNGKGVDWKEAVPIGPLAQQINGVTRRDLIAQGMQKIQAIPTGNTGLNDSLWAAYQKMTKEYEADKVNTILVFTDGVGNDDPNGGISNAQILRKLKAAFNPERPISILIISFNTTADDNKAQMNAIAKTTGGQAFFPQTVLEIRQIFLQGIARRLCAPNCGGNTQQ